MFCIAFLVRIYIGTPIVAFLTPRLISNRLNGFVRGAATTLLSVSVTSPITSGIVALMFTEPDNFLNSYIMALSTTMPLTMLVSYFVVGPLVKLLFHNRIMPADGLWLLKNLQQHAASIARILGM